MLTMIKPRRTFFGRSLLIASLALSSLTYGISSNPAFAQETDLKTSQKTEAVTSVDLEQKKAFEEMIKDYLLNNPEVIINSLNRYQELQAQREVDQKQLALENSIEELQNSPGSPVLGNPDGDVVLVEFFDYRCPYCHKAAAIVKQLVEDDPNLKVVMKEFPILSPESTIAARAALAAEKQGKYLEYHFALMVNSSDLSQIRLLALAEELGMDSDQFSEDMRSPEIGQEILQTRELARKIGANGTPTFVVGTYNLAPNTTYEEFKAIIQSLRTNKQS